MGRLVALPHGLPSLCSCIYHCPVQRAGIVSLVLGLGPRDGEGGFVPRDGGREVIRDPRGAGVCVVDNISGSLAWGLLAPAGFVVSSD